MNFSFRRKLNIFSFFAPSQVYCACVMEVCDFFHKSGAFFTNRGQMQELELGRLATVISSDLPS